MEFNEFKALSLNKRKELFDAVLDLMKDGKTATEAIVQLELPFIDTGGYFSRWFREIYGQPCLKYFKSVILGKINKTEFLNKSPEERHLMLKPYF